MAIVFSKRLTKTDVDVKLSFPMKVLNVFKFPEGKDKVEFEVTNHSTGESWKFRLFRRHKACHIYPKQILSSVWRAFVQEKGLKMNDRFFLFIEKDKATKTRLKIRAQRKVPTSFKFGKEIKYVEL
ncbi:hypothetical protein CRYUN_Cryun18bG0103300 [Craigia yunnanensis]